VSLSNREKPAKFILNVSGFRPRQLLFAIGSANRKDSPGHWRGQHFCEQWRPAFIEGSELPGIDALELADLFILKRYRRKGIGRAIASQVLCSGERNWLVRFYDQDEVSQAFWRTVLDNLPRPVQSIELDDEPQWVNYLITRASLH